MPPPDWVKHAVFYQIFPDRFARSGRVEAQETVDLKPWGRPPEEQGFHGGDLYGVIDRLEYLEALGVTALYLNPVFASAANHRYHTYDYYEVDPLLGGNVALRELLDAAHARGMRVVLDGVFNHASRGFWPFHHVLENGPDSPYTDWFLIQDWPLRPYASGPGTPHNYAAWNDLPALPEFNIGHPPVREFLLDVARHWIEFGIDGWRLDVPREIDAPNFWRSFRDVVKTAKPDAYLVGEIWTEAPSWVGSRFDGLMNYPLLDATLSFFGAGSLRDYQKPELDLDPLDGNGFAEAVGHLLETYDEAAVQAQLNVLDSHDMARAKWILGEKTRALRQAVLFIMTMPGAPCIYYGDEIGLSAAGDPHCREAFPEDRHAWDLDLLDFYRAATGLRHENEVLRIGALQWLHAEERVVAFRRRTEDDEAIVAFNAGHETARVPLSSTGSVPLTLAWSSDDADPDSMRSPGRSHSVSIPPRATLIWTTPS